MLLAPLSPQPLTYLLLWIERELFKPGEHKVKYSLGVRAILNKISSLVRLLPSKAAIIDDPLPFHIRSYSGGCIVIKCSCSSNMPWLHNHTVPTLGTSIERECLEQEKDWLCPLSCCSAHTWNAVSSSGYLTLMPIHSNSSTLKREPS